MSDPFQSLHHICLVVHDIDKTAEYYRSIGVGPWQDYPPFSTYSRLEMPNLNGFLELKFKFANLQNTQLQLCQPSQADTPQRRFLDQHGEGVFHLGFTVPNCDQAEADAAAMGLSVIMSGRRPDEGGFTYFNTAEKFGGITILTRALPVVKR